MRFLLLLVSCLMLAGCAAPVVYDYDDRANFQQDKTFEFERAKNGDTQSLDRSRIHQAVLTELENKGYTKVDNDASLIVRYRIEEEIRIESTGVSYGVGMSRNHLGFGMHTPVRSREIKEGKLVVEIVEAQDNRVIWRAVSQKRLTEQMKPDARTALINELVTEMFTNYPPQRK
ncbi:DUF4136 domain-containing protein [Alkalimarinus sediminis]|uniref:DUF4136 domain-containing protein n=1 Tax=Alkalimarinus sediminis TaxID=1632866 RepID=A0A9E8HFA2_9ALTE|nr:DUF4136 domain-containing protein [Alkalimarinus sediminis]UZW73573.1 DUF4136 domain-containing protein [Alkalimarinus sediminis]